MQHPLIDLGQARGPSGQGDLKSWATDVPITHCIRSIPVAFAVHQPWSLSLDDTNDRFSSVSFGTDESVSGRLGARLQGETTINGIALQPYLKANIWRDFGGTDRVSFDTTDITTEGRSTSFEFGGGVVAKVTDKVSLFATGDYTTNLGGDKRRILEGNVGISVKW
ncbi:hypothetical protein BAE42_27165 [Mesorhizobium loti]|nr:autotransporter outer membrane beta-barrel domain-containing protein [Mesorhizobium japonicum]OBP79050.1 hypothetical protein BAE42_27165 [Mesorhizobium loti]OBP89742.1 hypothetical protein BAE41_23745 [Mesorhizobium loti]OBP97816.1 hypothetical protein BAE38_02840 [Mesorhizobium loti]